MDAKDAIVGPNQKPAPHPFYGDSWERGLDPWHANAFKGLGLSHNPGTTGERRGGWFLIDGAGNAIGFVPDGSSVGSASEQKALIVVEPSPPETRVGEG